MKIFWAIVVALLIGFGALLVLDGPAPSTEAEPVSMEDAASPAMGQAGPTLDSTTPDPSRVEALEVNASAEPATPIVVAAQPEAVPEVVSTRTTTTDSTPSDSIEAMERQIAEQVAAPEQVTTELADAELPDPDVHGMVTEAKATANEAAFEHSTVSATVDAGPTNEVSVAAEALAETVTSAAVDAVAAAESGDASVAIAPATTTDTVADANLTVLADRFTITGAGTAEKPFVLPWELLVSARENYNPRIGQTQLPEWTQLLQGKVIRLSGHLLAPVVSTETSEMLVMMNQWDGCCIGVPPTPYDAVEVKYEAPLSLAQVQSTSFGAIQGVLDIDPYLYNDWLLGLYVIRDARLIPNAR